MDDNARPEKERTAKDGLDVVVRFHDARRLRELGRAIFSLISQSYRPLRILLAVQRFTLEDLTATREALTPFLMIEGAPDLVVLNWDEAEPLDSRSMLINLGIQAAKGRYLAFLDYDDLLYPEAYELLIDRLREARVAVAFGGICAHEIEVFDSYLHSKSKSFPLNGCNLIDLFSANFCPIHSFVLDRLAISPQHLFFEPMMNRNEDYDFLVRVCSQYPSDFSLIKKYIGVYCMKNDGSNTILTESSATPEHFSAWAAAERFLEARRQTTPLSAHVSASLGLEPTPGPPLTVRAFLDQRRVC